MRSGVKLALPIRFSPPIRTPTLITLSLLVITISILADGTSSSAVDDPWIPHIRSEERQLWSYDAKGYVKTTLLDPSVRECK